MTPASTTTMRWFPFARAPTRSTSSTATMEKAKAEAETPNAAAPRRMAMAAPNAAPCEAPRMSGETSGFWNVPWNAAPAAARLQPTMRPSRMRGRRTLKKSVACWSVQNASRGKRREASMPSASSGEMG